MIETKYPMTPAIRTLKDHGVPFVIHAYAYEEHGRMPGSAACWPKSRRRTWPAF